MTIYEAIDQANIDQTKDALNFYYVQVESLFGMLEPHMDENLIESLKTQYQNQIIKKLSE